MIVSTSKYSVPFNLLLNFGSFFSDYREVPELDRYE